MSRGLYYRNGLCSIGYIYQVAIIKKGSVEAIKGTSDVILVIAQTPFPIREVVSITA